MKIFDLYETSEVKVEDMGLKRVINLDEKLVLKTHGRHVDKFGKAKVNIVERIVNLLGVPGHRGKKHKVMTSWASGKHGKNTKIVLEALRIISEKTGQNPIQVLVKAVENSTPRDEITTIEYGGARYPQAVDVSPIRRVALSLRNIVHGAYDKAFGKKTTMAEALANEIILSNNGSNESFAFQKRVETEKQADSAR
ncbi:MAG: 30S ribosomal protein S7 [Nanoarchaeota archaeon]|nr:30S ribosomal protein S7 [Nanoarchaeota archaeon]MBU4086449.1 30S ribosomal protein S7 [Nanoarchaeota archaeon]